MTAFDNISCTLRRLLIIFLIVKGVALLKKKAIFFLLIFCPKADSYIASKFRIFSHSEEFALQNNKLSSTKNKWVNLGPCLQIEKPLRSPSTAAFVISPCNPLVHKRNRKRDNESPCLIPLVGWIRP